MPRLGRTAATILYRKGLYSVSQRTNTEAFSGYFQFPGGRADYPEEDFLEIAWREVLEETGLDLDRSRFIDLGPNAHDYDCAECRMFCVELADDEEPQWLEKHKSTAWEWVPIEQLRAWKDQKLIDGVADIAERVEKELTSAKNSIG